MYSLSEKAIAEKYEDLLFTKVMALYAAEESEKILSEIENEEPADPKNIEKIYLKTERRENLSVFWKVSKKLITVAAMVVFVAVVSLSSVVVASAEAREAVAEAIYHLVLRKTDRYTEVSIGNSTGFIDPELYDWEGAYAPTYIPEGFVFSEKQELPSKTMIVYSREREHFIISQATSGITRVDTENAQVVKNILIGDSEALYVEKNNFTYIVWMSGDVCLSVTGKISSDEAVKIAEGIKPIGKTEEPAEEYEFVDPENYDWEGAYAPTYIPEGFNFVECVVGLDSHSNTYENNEKFVIIEQKNKNYTTHIDTENTQIVKNIIINNCEALFIEKDGLAYITWCYEDTLFFICGNIKSSEIIKIAEGIKPIGKTATEEPTEEYEFVDPEIYTWENAFALTYIPKKYALDEIYDLDLLKIVNYVSGEKYFSLSQLREETIYTDTENADKIKDIIIGNSKGLLITKGDISSVYWSVENTLLSVTGNIDENEIIKIAEGVRPIN